MELDANTFAKWDVDYVKLDGCYADIDDMDKGYPEFGRLLNATGRPMVYSCSWPVYQEEKGKTVSKRLNVTDLPSSFIKNNWRNQYQSIIIGI